MADPVQRPRGTRDFAPAEMAVRHEVAQRMRGVLLRFAYREIATPAFEELELFTAKSGEGILSELYNFKDKGDRDVCLRPELTAPAMRMYFQEHFNDPKPIKWFYHGACYRYDRPQAGRYREFWQFGCEQIGAGTPLAYAELLALADAVMREVGLEQRDFFVGHVGILRSLVDTLGLQGDDRGQVMRLIDKRDDRELRPFLEQRGATAQVITRLFAAMDARDIEAVSTILADDPNLAELRQTFQHLEAFGVKNVRLNLGIARGLDYYTGIVFEMHCPILGAEKQLLGGGGYDLSKVFDGQPTPTMGFGLGFDRTIVALEKQAENAGIALVLGQVPGPLVYFAALSEAALSRVLPIVAQLRGAGVQVELDLIGRKPGAVAKHADAIRARNLVIVGDRDLEAGQVEAKELGSGLKTVVRLDALVGHFG